MVTKGKGTGKSAGKKPPVKASSKASSKAPSKAPKVKPKTPAKPKAPAGAGVKSSAKSAGAGVKKSAGVKAKTSGNGKPPPQPQLATREIEFKGLRDYVEGAYLNYSMYVILDRALPQLADGLKPSQRRIVYAMSELGLRSGSKYKKSARTIGDVIGKFHPHGDASCYETMVLMAQDFTTRYCLVDGQGNWGSIDNAKSFAAMRYTEARLTAYAQLLLGELHRKTTEWQPNFDGTMDEPVTLPVQVPNILLNGSTGIAVGMTTDIPSHNLTEIIDACLLLLEKPELCDYLVKKGKGADKEVEGLTPAKLNSRRKAAVKELMKVVTGPDFAAGGQIISSQEEILDAYTTGVGALTVRAGYEIKGKNIIVTELPPQTSTYEIVDKIEEQMQNRKLPMLANLRDESDNENPVMLVLETRRGSDPERLMAHLFATTKLEKRVRVNMNAINLEGSPGILSLNEMLWHWLEYRRACVIKRLKNDLENVNNRLHILEGLLTAYLNLDEVIRIIRKEDKPKPVLMKKFKLSDAQTESILETKLRHLARLEEEKIKAEEEELTDKKYFLEKTLGSKDGVTKMLKEGFEEIKKEYGDERHTKILGAQEGVPKAETFSEVHIVSREPVTLFISTKGWVRLAKGHDIQPRSFSYRESDDFLAAWRGYNNQTAIFLDSHGRAYNVQALNLPSARGLGEPLSSRLDIADGALVDACLFGDTAKSYLLVAKDGNGFIIGGGELLNISRKKGKQIMKIKGHAGLVQPIEVPGGVGGDNVETGNGEDTGNGAADTNGDLLETTDTKDTGELGTETAATEATGEKVDLLGDATDAPETDVSLQLCCLTKDNRLLILPFTGIPRMNKGKGIRLINADAEKDPVKQALILPVGEKLEFIDPSKPDAPALTLEAKDQKPYIGNRAGKGKFLDSKLPKSLQMRLPTPPPATPAPE